MGRRFLAVAAALAAVAAACVAGPSGGDEPPEAPAPEAAPAPTRAPTDAYVDGSDLVLAFGGDGDHQVLATVDDGELLHAALRPGKHEQITVLALTRVDDPRAAARYELRYVVVTPDGDASDLFWLPWRLQVDPAVAEVLDVPPVPVWAPDGGAIAWLEWVEGSTRLRTVGWRDEGSLTNPSDDASVYRLDEVPPGTHLEAWEYGDDGHVLVARSDGERWSIRLQAAGGPVVDPADATGSPS